jgi:outer membrane protein assembly factor BamB
MRHRFAVVVVVALGAAALAPAQPSGTYSKAAPPDKAVLDRLNLKSEWTQYIPVEGNRDALTQVQTIDDQVFVQTRGGLLVALDALTGRIQWAARLGNGSYGNSYPVAANAQFVFVSHVTKLYAFYRYTGVTEFVADLGTTPTTGLACDDRAVYCVLGMRSGSAGAHRIAVYDLPRAITVNDPVKAAVDPLGQGAKPTATSPVDDLLKRYNAGGITTQPDVFEPTVRPKVLEVPVGGVTGSKTPSVSTLPSVVPPYSLGNRAPAPSLNTLPSFRQPYHVRLEAGKYVQQTPSIGVIPPSIAASMLLADLRPKAVEPPLRWEYGLTARILYPLILTPTRVWAVTEGDVVLALNKNSEAGKVVTEVKERLTSAIPAAPMASGKTYYVPLGNGTMVAVEGGSGNLAGGLNILWRAVPGGIMNRSPFITKDFVYASGDDSGVVCVHRFNGPFKGAKPAEPPKPGDPPKAGEPAKMDEMFNATEREREYYGGDTVWRSDDSADRIIGANEEFVYIRDRQGRFLVFDAKRATDPARKKSAPLGSANLSEFNVHVVNTASDRVYLAADNGLIVCVRDASPKYAKPVVIWPPADVNPAKKIGVETQGGIPGMPGTGMEPKKDPEPKKEPEKKP